MSLKEINDAMTRDDKENEAVERFKEFTLTYLPKLNVENLLLLMDCVNVIIKKKLGYKSMGEIQNGD
jgi:hypothetical protein